MKIGPLTVEQGVLLAPMEDVTDPAFRLICKRLGADIVYTEFISSEGLIRDARRSLDKLLITDEERPVAIQIFGGHIPTMVEAAVLAEQAAPDFLDINCGCWVKNVVARNAGAALLKDPPQMVAMAKALVEAVDLPVTLKTRLGWDKNSIVIVELAQRLEDAGIAALCIHCRTREMGHNGDANWEWISKVKAAVSMPVILNGDIKTPEDARRAFEETGCDAVMVGRGAISNPFIFRQIKSYLSSGVHEEPPSAEERIETLIDHLRLSLELKGYQRGIREFRKFYSGYLKGLHCASTARGDLVHYDSFDAIEERLRQFQVFLAAYEHEQQARESVLAMA